LLLILFVPIRYHADLNLPQKDLSGGIDTHFTDEITADAGFSFLLHLIRGRIVYPQAPQFTVKVLFFTVFPHKKKSEGRKADKKEENRTEKNTEKDVNTDSEIKTEKSAQGRSEREAEPGSDEEWISPEKEENTGNKGHGEDAAASSEQQSANWEGYRAAIPPEEEKNEGAASEDDAEQEETKSSVHGFICKCREILQRIINFLKTQQNVLKKTGYTISRICGKISMIKETLESNTFQRAWKVASGQLLKVWKRLRPGKCDIDLVYGTEDPALTAQILGIYGIMYPFLPDGVSVNAVFDAAVIGCTAKVRGSITVFRLLWCAGMIYFNKDIRRVYKRFRRIMAK
jgi:hypothetical protein